MSILPYRSNHCVVACVHYVVWFCICDIVVFLFVLNPTVLIFLLCEAL